MQSEQRWNMHQMPANGFTMIDLFCGAGIGATGFLLAGFKIVFAIDIQPYAVKAYNQNIGNHAVCGDIRLLPSSKIPNADIITGGFPCQPFSFNGSGRGENDEVKGDLGYHFYRIVKEKQPKAFLMENVDGIISKKHLPFFKRLMKAFEEAGYNLSYPQKDNGDPTYIDCYDYGVPQHRKRVFVIGIRKDLNKSFVFPDPASFAIKSTVRDAIGDLGEPCLDRNHIGYGIRKDEAPFVDKVPPGGNWRDLDDDDQRTFLGKAYYSGGGRTGFLRKIQFDKPSFTITSMMNGKNNAQILDNRDKYGDELFNSMNIQSCRRFTVRECLRLQTVPDWFTFPNDMKLRHQYERCSGIPSLVAYHLGIELSRTLSETLAKEQIK